MKSVAIITSLFAALATANVVRTPPVESCIIEKGFDRPGGDYGSSYVGLDNFDACVSACKLDSKCFVVRLPFSIPYLSFHTLTYQSQVNYHTTTGWCYFKEKVTNQKADVEVDGAVCRPSCNRDNCFRQLIQNPTTVGPFCQQYTQAVNTATALPTFASMCAGSPQRVSSACSCLHPKSAAATPTPTP